MEQQPLALGIDIGGTNTAFGIVDRRGQVLAKGSMPTKGYSTAHQYVKALAKEVAPLIKKVKRQHITGIGVGAPNGNYYTGEIVQAANLEWHGIIPIAEMFREAFGLSVTITNDANAAAIGEMQYGVARGMKDFIMITLGTGVGSGIVANGQLVYGHDGFAGEVGHMIAVRDGRECGCGRMGCLEKYCSASGVAYTAEKWLDVRTDKSLLRDMKGKITSKTVYDVALTGDKLALDVFDYTGMLLGQTLADVVAITSPQAIVFFGGLAKAGDMLLKPVKKHLENNLLHIYKGKIELLQSALPDADAAILGASALVW
ncbi:glucokinase [Chitinophagaceae bacterium IBVUCB1]|nr:glucokinase [Chitinophagaceae bacterium IBVUCB1]